MANSGEISVKLDVGQFENAPKSVLIGLIVSLIKKASFSGKFEAVVENENHGGEHHFHWIKVASLRKDSPLSVMLGIRTKGTWISWSCALQVPHDRKAGNLASDFLRRLRDAAFILKKESEEKYLKDEPVLQTRSKGETPKTVDVPEQGKEETVAIPADEPDVTEGAVVSDDVLNDPEEVQEKIAEATETAFEDVKSGRRTSVPKLFSEHVLLDFISRFVEKADGEFGNIDSYMFIKILREMSLDCNAFSVKKHLLEKGIISVKNRGPHLALMWLTQSARARYNAMLDLSVPDSANQRILELEKAVNDLRRKLERSDVIVESLEKKLCVSDELLSLVYVNLKRRALAIGRLMRARKQGTIDALEDELTRCDEEDSRIFKILEGRASEK